MKLSVNYSHEAKELLQERLFDCDLFKCPDWPDLVRQAEEQKPAVVHFDLQAGNGLVSEERLLGIEQMLETTSTYFVNTHFAPRPLSSDDRPTRAELMQRVTEDIQQLAERFGPKRIIVETIYKVDGYFQDISVDIDAISEVIKTCGVGLLLDLAHTRLAAQQLGIPQQDYIEALPISSLRELHATGTSSANGEFMDHCPMSESDWATLAWALDQIHSGRWPTPHMLGFEYGGVGGPYLTRTDINVMREQFPRLEKLVRSYFPA